MKFDKRETNFLKVNEETLNRIFDKRVEELKEMLLDVPDEGRNDLIKFANENRFWKSVIQNVVSDKPTEEFTGI